MKPNITGVVGTAICRSAIKMASTPNQETTQSTAIFGEFVESTKMGLPQLSQRDLLKRLVSYHKLKLSHQPTATLMLKHGGSSLLHFSTG